VANVITAITEQLHFEADAWGIYHYCSADRVSEYQFAEAILAQAAQYGEPGSTEPISRAQADLSHTGGLLGCQKILNTFGIKQRSWRRNLPAAVREYCL
jgi:dTDP-4-dehydrorhamnose reductase